MSCPLSLSLKKCIADSENDNSILTDPVIMTPDARFGGADMGKKQIMKWFERHKCGKCCKPHWKRARDWSTSGIPGSMSVTEGTQMDGFGTGKGNDTRSKVASSKSEHGNRYNSASKYDTGSKYSTRS